MKIVSPVQPLIFWLSDADRLLDAVQRVNKYGCPCALSRFCGGYYLTVRAGLNLRQKIKTELGEFGSFCGIGVVLDAYIAEHGQRISESLPLRRV